MEAVIPRFLKYSCVLMINILRCDELMMGRKTSFNNINIFEVSLSEITLQVHLQRTRRELHVNQLIQLVLKQNRLKSN